MEYRQATADDAEAIAGLHADSWKRGCLLAETARTVARRRPSSGLYLLVLEQNTAAQAFYRAKAAAAPAVN